MRRMAENLNSDAAVFLGRRGDWRTRVLGTTAMKGRSYLVGDVLQTRS